MPGRIRTIKPELLEDAVAAGLSDAAFRLYIAGIMLADDFGNLRANAEWLRGQVWWNRGDPPKVADVRGELVDAGLWKLYSVRGQEYAAIRNWAKHQRTDNASKPRVPQPNDPDSTLTAPALGDSPQLAENLGDSPPSAARAERPSRVRGLAARPRSPSPTKGPRPPGARVPAPAPRVRSTSHAKNGRTAHDPNAERIDANDESEHARWLVEAAKDGLFGAALKAEAEAGTVDVEDLERIRQRVQAQRAAGAKP